MRSAPAIKVVPTAEALAEKAVDILVRAAGAAVRCSGVFTLLLSGGTTPDAVYRRLAQPGASSRLEWSRVHLFWGDERCVSTDHADSNYGMVQRSLLNHIPIPAGNVHRIPAEQGAAAAAESYAAELNRFFGGSAGKPPCFDLALLGLGEDGHTASLFPGSPALEEAERWAVGVAHSLPPPPLVPRVTVTLPAINAARRVLFLVSGGSKADILYRIILGDESPQLPAQRVNPASLRITWLVDGQAAKHFLGR
jgi:6-phosphogluconolactonase